MLTLRESPIRRVVLVVLDGLRPDAIPRYDLPHLNALVAAGRSTMFGRTVAPSVTACAMASLLTGATPERHGLQGAKFAIPRPRGTLRPLPRHLAQHGYPSSAFLAAVPFLFGPIAKRISAHVGVADASFRGNDCHAILEAGRRALAAQRRGLILFHWPDGDRAGHAGGWMSDRYEQAVRRMDDALGQLVEAVTLDDPHTLIVAMSDHGGGGARVDHHDSEHPLDRTIPIILAGGAVSPGSLPVRSSLLDVPPTICRALGIPQPESYAGFPLVEEWPAHVLSAA